MSEFIDPIKKVKKKVKLLDEASSIIKSSLRQQLERQREIKGLEVAKTQFFEEQAKPIVQAVGTQPSEEEKKIAKQNDRNIVVSNLNSNGIPTYDPSYNIILKYFDDAYDTIKARKTDALKQRDIDMMVSSIDSLLTISGVFEIPTPIGRLSKNIFEKIFLNRDFALSVEEQKDIETHEQEIQDREQTEAELSQVQAEMKIEEQKREIQAQAEKRKAEKTEEQLKRIEAENQSNQGLKNTMYTVYKQRLQEQDLNIDKSKFKSQLNTAFNFIHPLIITETDDNVRKLKIEGLVDILKDRGVPQQIMRNRIKNALLRTYTTSVVNFSRSKLSTDPTFLNELSVLVSSRVPLPEEGKAGVEEGKAGVEDIPVARPVPPAEVIPVGVPVDIPASVPVPEGLPLTPALPKPSAPPELTRGVSRSKMSDDNMRKTYPSGLWELRKRNEFTQDMKEMYNKEIKGKNFTASDISAEANKFMRVMIKKYDLNREEVNKKLFEERIVKSYINKKEAEAKAKAKPEAKAEAEPRETVLEKVARVEGRAKPAEAKTSKSRGEEEFFDAEGEPVKAEEPPREALEIQAEDAIAGINKKIKSGEINIDSFIKSGKGELYDSTASVRRHGFAKIQKIAGITQAEKEYLEFLVSKQYKQALDSQVGNTQSGSELPEERKKREAKQAGATALVEATLRGITNPNLMRKVMEGKGLKGKNQKGGFNFLSMFAPIPLVGNGQITMEDLRTKTSSGIKKKVLGGNGMIILNPKNFKKGMKKQSNEDLLNNLKVHMAQVQAGNTGLKEPIQMLLNEALGRGIMKKQMATKIGKNFL